MILTKNVVSSVITSRGAKSDINVITVLQPKTKKKLRRKKKVNFQKHMIVAFDLVIDTINIKCA